MVQSEQEKSFNDILRQKNRSLHIPSPEIQHIYNFQKNAFQ